MIFKDSSFIVCGHYRFFYEPPLIEYLIRKKIRYIFEIAHPLYADGQKSQVIHIKGSKKKFSALALRFPVAILNYLLEPMQTCRLVFKEKQNFDCFIGYDNLNTLAGLILRKLGRVRQVVYYTIDYSPKRFPNRILNFIYHKIDKYCVAHADITWNVSPKIQEARETYKNMRSSGYARQKVVPIGIWTDDVHLPSFEETHSNQAIFMGHILKKQGVQFVLEAMPLIISQVKNFKFIVIGDGEYLPRLKEMVQDLGIQDHVTFLGRIDDFKEAYDKMKLSAMGVATYQKYDDHGKLNFSNFADPGKIKDYMVCGLPIVMTDVPPQAYELSQKECAFIVETEASSIAKTITAILNTPRKLKTYRENCLRYIQDFDWGKIYDEAFKINDKEK